MEPSVLEDISYRKKIIFSGHKLNTAFVDYHKQSKVGQMITVTHY